MDPLGCVVGSRHHPTHTPESRREQRRLDGGRSFDGPPNVRPQHGLLELLKGVLGLLAAISPRGDDELHQVRRDELLRNEGEQHEPSFDFLSEPPFLGPLTHSLLDRRDGLRCVLPEVLDKVEETTLHHNGLEVLLDGVDQSLFKVAHEGDRPVEHAETFTVGKLLDKAQELV